MSAAGNKLQAPNWQRAIAEAYTQPAELLRDLGLDPAAAWADRRFAMRVPRSYAARIRRGDPRDPLLLQVLPRAEEGLPAAGFVDDPLDELATARQPGMLQKYAGRALIVSTGACAVHCRYCFRRAFPYREHLSGRRGFADIIDALQRDRAVTEVILSGGDPLSLSDQQLGELLDGLDAVRHLSRIRVHTRTPIVLPERVDAGLLRILARVDKSLVVVLHCNHAREIDAAVRASVRALRQTTTTLLNQSVLLAGVNDSVAALVDLSETLFDAGVLPYYLHQLDPVSGAAHFSVSDARARELVARVAAKLPGYLVPRLVRDVPGAAAKMPL